LLHVYIEIKIEVFQSNSLYIYLTGRKFDHRGTHSWSCYHLTSAVYLTSVESRND